jgi:LysM repeat protein
MARHTLRPALLLTAVLAVLLAVSLPAAPASAQSLTGGQASLDRQNARAAANDFTFLATPAEVRRFVAQGLLVPVEGNQDYTIDDEVSYPVARPEVRLFIERLAGQYRAACGEQLVVTSLTRPKSAQPSNASDRSVHPTGMAIDFRRPVNSRCRRWLEQTLLSLEGKHVLEATRETSPPHLHVAIFPVLYAQYVSQLTGASVAEIKADARRPDTYIVQPADTLWDLARHFGTSVEALRDANSLKTSRIYPGQELTVPGVVGG